MEKLSKTSVGEKRRKKKCIRYLREDGASSDGENDDDGSSHLGSHRSTCDTDSTHDADADSPHPLTRHLGMTPQHSPLSPLLPDERGETAPPTTLSLGFPPPSSSTSSPFSLLSPLPSHQPCPSPLSQPPPLSVVLSLPVWSLSTSTLPQKAEWSTQFSLASSSSMGAS
ncbi:hypothetical protein ACOMHN_004948 [Nucella lapillus]